MGVSVKQLGWVSIGNITFAATPFGSYEVRPNTIEMTTNQFDLAIPGEKIAKLTFRTEDEAKHEASEDFDRRVKASISPLPEENEGLSEWGGWDQSNYPWSQAHHQDAVCEAVFGPTWSMEDAHALITFINRTWQKRALKADGESR